MEPWEQELRKGLMLAVEGAPEDALRAFERSRALKPDALDPNLNLLEALQGAGRMDEAEALAAELLQRWAREQVVLLAVANLRERQGRVEEALQLVRDLNVDLTPDSAAYPDYLRILLENGHFEEAVVEATAGLQSLWRAGALLARAVALLHLGESEMAQKAVNELDVDEFRDLIREWAKLLWRSRITSRTLELIAQAKRSYPANGRLESLYSIVAECRSETSP